MVLVLVDLLENRQLDFFGAVEDVVIDQFDKVLWLRLVHKDPGQQERVVVRHQVQRPPQAVFAHRLRHFA